MRGFPRLLAAAIAMFAAVFGCSKSANIKSANSAVAPRGLNRFEGTWIAARPDAAIAVMDVRNDGRVTAWGLQRWSNGQPILGDEQSASAFVLEDGRLAVAPAADGAPHPSFFPATLNGSDLSFGPRAGDEPSSPTTLQYYNALRADVALEIRELHDKIARLARDGEPAIAAATGGTPDREALAKKEMNELQAELREKIEVLQSLDKRIGRSGLVSVLYAGVDFHRLDKGRTIAEALHAAMPTAPATQAE